MTITVTFTESTVAAVVSDILAFGSIGATGTITQGGTTTTPGGTVTPGGTIAPGAGLTFPYPMPANISGGSAVTLGTGPDSIVINASNNPGSPIANQFVVIVEQGTTQTAVAGPLTCSAETGMNMAGDQVFTIFGTFPGITGVQLVAAGNGLNGLWVNQLSVGLIPWVQRR